MKKLKLKKKVKVITTLLSFGMLLTVLPSMKLVAEDDTTTDTSDISVGPYIKYEASEDNYYSDEVSNDSDFTTLEANGGIAVATDNTSTSYPVINENGSYTYDGSVTVDKTISEVKDTNGESKGYYKIDLSASNTKWENPGVDYILLLDMSSNMNGDGLTALKNALLSFVNEVNERSKASRIAMVKYSNENASVVLTNNGNNSSNIANRNALVQLNSKVNTKSGKEYLDEVVNSLANPSGDSFSEYAMLDGLKIFQDSNTNDIELDPANPGKQYKDRTRVCILFTAGYPGKGTISDNDLNKDEIVKREVCTDKDGNSVADNNYRLTGWSRSARNSAQATMSMATVMKEKKGIPHEFSDSENDSSVASGDSWSTLKTKFDNSWIGCGATVYSVGLNLDEAIDPVGKSRDSITQTIRIPTTTSYYDVNGLSRDMRKKALVNEYLYRVSSHRKTGRHYLLDEAKTEDPKFYTEYNNLGNNKDLYDGMYYLYPDCITRNQDNSYFLTAKTNENDRLKKIFSSIAIQVGSKLECTVRDYIDPSFIPVNQNGEKIVIPDGEEKIEAYSDGKYKGYLCYDSDKQAYYIEWVDVKLVPESKQGAGDAEIFGQSIYVKRASDTIGGNNLYTNTSDSGIYSGSTNKYAFPMPTVDLEIKYQLKVNDQNIYITNSVDLKSLISNEDGGVIPNGTNNKGVSIVYIFKVGEDTVATLTVGPEKTLDEGEINWIGNSTPYSDQDITISCTVTSNSTSDHDYSDTNHHSHLENVSEETYGDDNTISHVNVYKPELAYKDLHIFYGDSKPNYDGENGALKTTTWKHGNTVANSEVMGDAPKLIFEYTGTPTSFPVKKDYKVKVTVKVNDNGIDITDNTTFAEKTCNDPCNRGDSNNHDESLEDGKRFIVHVDTCALTITKEGGTSGETYFFTIKKKEKTDDSKEDYIDYTKASITVGSDKNQVVIKELPVGDYQITEDDDTSWRYESKFDENSSAEVSLNKNNSSALVTCKNTKNNDKWLNKISSVAKNVYTKITTNE